MSRKLGISGSSYRPLAQDFWSDSAKMFAKMFGVLAAGIITVDVASASMGNEIDAIGRTCSSPIFEGSVAQAPCESVNRGATVLTRMITGKPTILRH